MAALDRTGTFTAHVISRGKTKSSQKGTIGLKFTFYALNWYNVVANAWDDVSALGMTIDGTIWIIGGDGVRRDGEIARAKDVFGWNGKLSEFDPGSTWQPPDCEIEVKIEINKGISEHKVRWINPLGRGLGGEIPADEEAALQALLDGPAQPAGQAIVRPAAVPSLAPTEEVPF